jgi:CHAT domain-containing protein/Tfp pilus assembly protein PilF
MGDKRINKFLYFIIPVVYVFFASIFIHSRIELRPVISGLQSLKAGNFNKAIINFSKYLELSSAENKSTLKCRVNLGLAFWNQDKLEKANEQFAKGEELAKKLHSTKELQFCSTALLIHELYQKGRELYSRGDLQKSIDSFSNAVEKARLIRSPDHELKIVKAWSMVLLNKSGSREYLTICQRALHIAQSIHHHGEIVGMLNNIGTFYLIKNEYSNALINHLKCAQEAKKYNETKDLIFALSNVSADYVALGDFRRAFESVSEALALSKSTGFAAIRTDLLMKLGSAIFLKGSITGDPDDYAHSLKCFQEALELFRKAGDKNSILFVLSAMGEAYINLRQYEKARDLVDACFDMVIPKSAGLVMARLYNDRGVIELSIGDSKRAETEFKRALDIGRLMDSANSCLRSYFGLAKCCEKQKLNDSALDYYSKSIEIIRNIGSNINNDIDQACFIQNKTAVYQNYVDLCYRLIQDRHNVRYGRELFAVMEMAKARSFIEFIDKRNLTNTAIPLSVEDLQNRLLDSKTALLEYFLGESVSYLILTTKSKFQIYKLPRRRDISDSLSGYLGYCEQPQLNHSLGENASSRLFKELLSPAIADLPGSVEHLIIVPDGILYRLPFETLIIENESMGIKRYLIENYSVSYAPSATALSVLLDRPKPGNYPKDLLAIGSPKYPTSMSVTSVPNSPSEILQQSFMESGIFISPLPYSREEVKEIAALFGSDKRNIYLGNAARERILKNVDPGCYRIIHIACHAVSDDTDSYRSAIVFSLTGADGEDGFLQLWEMYELQLKSDLVVLSACQTGKGQIITNEGMLGLPRVFFYAGAFTVVSSLWNVEDKATAQFMKSFYRSLLGGQSKAQALRLAKIEFIKSKYSHPFYWSAFVLTGDYSSSIH